MKPAQDFPTNARNLDGLDARCKSCAAAATRAWRHANPEAARASEEKWRNNNPDRVRERGRDAVRRHLKRNPGIGAEYARRWRGRNPELVKRAAAQHAKNNPVAYAIKAANRRARTKNATPSWLTPEHRQQIAAVYAEARRLTVETGTPHCVDHIVPLQSPVVCGLHVPWNLRAITRRENQRKWSHLAETSS